MRLILLLILLLVIVGALPAWPYSTGWGYYPSGLGLVLLIVLLIVLFRISETTPVALPGNAAIQTLNSHFIPQRPEGVSEFLQAQLQPRFHGPKRGTRGNCNLPVT